MPEKITGQVLELQLRGREGTSWGIAQVAIGSGDKPSELTGTLLGIAPGDTIEAVGAWRIHQKYGRQFVATSIRTTIPSDAAGFIGVFNYGGMPQSVAKENVSLFAREVRSSCSTPRG